MYYEGISVIEIWGAIVCFVLMIIFILTAVILPYNVCSKKLSEKTELARAEYNRQTYKFIDELPNNNN